ncbi:hypothetical protein FOMA001_g17368 [Fusarium oxysporum f. sp. matthiolae]|nr:hypothetical protein FOMA001_g17368 [Fusarium oxysporum f. sp. matthiolae]
MSHSQPYKPLKGQSYRPLKGYSFYLTDLVKPKLEGKISKNGGTLHKNYNYKRKGTMGTKYFVCSKAEYRSFRDRLAGSLSDKVDISEKDYDAMLEAYELGEKGMLDTGCLEAISDNSHAWNPIDWADSYGKKEPERRCDVWIQQMQAHGVYRLSSLLDEAIDVNGEDDMEAKSFDREYTKIADIIKDHPDGLALVNNWKDKYNELIALIRDVREVVGTLVQDETPVPDETPVQDETSVQDEGYESASTTDT